MSDVNKYVNVYIENALGLIHEYINILLKTKTEAKLVEELVKDRELDIAKLNEEIIHLKENNLNASEAQEKARVWEDQYNSMRQRVAHMDTMASGFNEIKQRLIEKNTQVDQMATELESLKQATAEKDIIINDLNEVKQRLIEKNTQVDQMATELESMKQATAEKDIIINDLNKKLKPFLKDVKVIEAKKPVLKKAEEKVESAPKKGAIRLSQLKIQKEEEKTDDF